MNNDLRSFAAIARALGWPYQTVFSLYQRGMTKLRRGGVVPCIQAVDVQAASVECQREFIERWGEEGKCQK